MDIDVAALPKLRVYPSSAPPTRMVATGNTDLGLAESGPPLGSPAAAAASVATPRLTRSAAHVEPSQRAARTGDAATSGHVQPSGSGFAAAGRPEPAVRVLPQRQGLHTPRGASASIPQGQRTMAASQAPGEGGPPPAPGGAPEAVPAGRISGPSSPRARSSGGPQSPRSPRAVTSASDRKTRAGMSPLQSPQCEQRSERPVVLERIHALALAASAFLLVAISNQIGSECICI